MSYFEKFYWKYLDTLHEITGVAFYLGQYSTSLPHANVYTCPISVRPMGCAVHDKWCTGRAWLIRSLSSARFCFELSGNLN